MLDKMRRVVFVGFILIALVQAILNSNRWHRSWSLDGYAASSGTTVTARNIISCGIECHSAVGCLSFFFISGLLEENCQLHNKIFMTSSGLVLNANAKYYISGNYSEGNYSSPTFQCHSNDGLYRTVQMEDLTNFTYKVNDAPASYDNAVSTCLGDGGMLVQAKTTAKLKMIQAMMFCPDLAVWNTYYVDGMYDVNNDSWYFSDGNLATFPNPFWYMPGQPNKPYLNPCVILAGSGWLAVSAKRNTPYPFICEK